jgi:Fe-S cluster assembly scaffold protein SufB
MMQTKGKRDYKHAYKLQKENGETEDQIERQRARRMVDKEATGKVTKKAPARKGKHIDHKTPIRAGGKSTKGNIRLRSAKANVSDNGK